MVDRIDDFVLLEELGQGGMAKVYRARQLSVNRIVALKVLPEHLEGHRESVRRFRRESRIAADLTHGNIVKVWSASHRPPYYMALEYLAGGTLGDRLQNGPMALDDALRIIVPICDALDCAHQPGVVHRDLKPANIMFDGTGRPVLVDFGIARADEHTRLTVSGSRFGTAEYMSPEQAQGKPVDRRSDIYSIAAVFYDTVCGRPPFQNEDPLVVLRQIIESPVPSPRSFNPTIPLAMEQALLRALHKYPSQRFTSAGAFAQALLRARPGPPTASPPPSPAEPLKPRRQERPTELTPPGELPQTKVEPRRPLQPGDRRQDLDDPRSPQPEEKKAQPKVSKPSVKTPPREIPLKRGRLRPLKVRRKALLAGLLAVVVAAVTIIAIELTAGVGGGGNSDPVPPLPIVFTSVPVDLVSMVEAEAKQKVLEADLKVRTETTVGPPDAAPGTVVSSNPQPGTQRIKVGTEVVLKIASAPPPDSTLKKATKAANEKKWKEVLKLTETSERTPDILNLRAAAYAGLEDWRQLETAARSSVRQRRTDAEAWSLLAYASYHLGRDPFARYAAKQAKQCPNPSKDALVLATRVLENAK